MINQSRNKLIYNVSLVVTSWFGIGKIPFAPGTLGSFAVYPLYIFLLHFFENNICTALLLSTTFLLVIGSFATHVVDSYNDDHDHKSIVIDEVVGMMIVLTLMQVPLKQIAKKIWELIATQSSSDFLPTNYVNNEFIVFFLAFIIFRFFDIKKPFFVGYIDRNISGTHGIMLDDIAAAFYSCVTIYLFHLFLI